MVNGERKESATTFLKAINKPALILWVVKQTVGYVKTHLDDLKAGKITIEQCNTNDILSGESFLTI